MEKKVLVQHLGDMVLCDAGYFEFLCEKTKERCELLAQLNYYKSLLEDKNK